MAWRSCSDLPASCSKCIRSMPILAVPPFASVDGYVALAHDRRLVLADLVALRQIRIEIILPVEHRFEIDLGVEAKAGAHRLTHAFRVDHRQHAGHGGIDQRHVRVRFAAECGRRAGKQLRLRGHLGMHLHADDHFPVAACAFDQFRFLLRRCIHFEFTRSWSRLSVTRFACPPQALLNPVGTPARTAARRRVATSRP